MECRIAAQTLPTEGKSMVCFHLTKKICGLTFISHSQANLMCRAQCRYCALSLIIIFNNLLTVTICCLCAISDVTSYPIVMVIPRLCSP